jgi:hypothetical protein
MFRKLLILNFQNYKTNQTLQVLPPKTPLSTIKQHNMQNLLSGQWSVRLFLDNITLMFLLNFQVEVIINMFIKREPTPYKEHEVNTPCLIKIISARNQDIIMVYESVIKVDIYGVGLANTRAQL